MKPAIRLSIVFFLNLTALTAQVSVSDSNALIDLYNNTNGNSWTTSTNWKTGPVGSWFGVTAASGRVVALDLNNNNLAGTIPASIGNLTNLASLELYGNQLTGSIPSTIGNITSLFDLGLENNQLSGQIPSSLGNLNILQVFTLSNNLFTDSIPVTFRNMASLQQLEVQGNDLNVFPDLSNIGTLSTLKLENNKFTFEDIQPNVGITTFTYSPQDSLGSYFTLTGAEAVDTIMVTTAGGTGNAYQWKRNGSPIALATNDTLYFDSLKIGDAGNYTCDVTNPSVPGLTLRRKTIALAISGSAPGTPSGVVASGITTSQISVTWNASSGVVTRYRVYRSQSAGSGFVQVDSVGSATTTVTNGSLSSNQVYYYRVAALGNFGVSAQSSSVSDTTRSVAPTAVGSGIPDTSLFAGFGKTFRRKLTAAFFDPDDATLSYTVQNNPAQIVTILSGDTLYIQSAPGFSSTASVIVQAADGYSAVNDTFNVIYVVDAAPPVIANIQKPSSTATNTNASISCQVTDNASVSAVRIFYRTGLGAFDSVNTSAGAGNSYSGQIPGAAITKDGVSFYFLARDITGNFAISDTLDLKVSFTQLSSATVANSEYPTGIPSNRWRLISIPADLDNKTLAPLFQGLLPDQYIARTYDNTKVSAINNAGAVWFYHNAGVEVTMTTGSGKTNSIDGQVVSLAPGWNFIGNPYPFEINSTALRDSTASFYGPLAYGQGNVEAWSGELATMKPFGGYAVFNKGASTRNITITPTTVIAKSGSSVAEAFRLRVRAEGVKQGITYGDLYNELVLLPESDAARYSAPEPAAANGMVSVFFGNKENWLTEQYQTIATSGHVVDWYAESALDQTRLSVEIATNQPGWDLRIFDLTHNVLVDRTEWVQASASSPVHYKLLIGTPSFIQSEINAIGNLPKAFTLSQNFPNPFNPETQIDYALSKQARVTLDVYNLLGQKVRSLVSGTQETGVQTVRWNGSDDRGRSVASGIYLYRLHLKDVDGATFTFTKKMLLVK